jgi:aminoglycoside phosphotransferase (APT) family kinase protein
VRTSDTDELALRRFPPGDDAVYREARVLAETSGLDELAPLLLAADPDGAQTGTPAILTTLLPGHGCITPDDSYGAARQLGRALAHLHAHPAGPGLPTVLTAPAQGTMGVEVSALAVAGLHLAWGRLAASAQVLTHNDFWSGNTLWMAGQLTGVVDWSGAGLAPRGFDLSWARLDLFLLHDRAVADAMTNAYETAADLSVPDIDVWDVYAATNAHAGIEGWAPNYRDLGRPDLGPAELRRRLGEWILPTFTTDASVGR